MLDEESELVQTVFKSVHNLKRNNPHQLTPHSSLLNSLNDIPTVIHHKHNHPLLHHHDTPHQHNIIQINDDNIYMYSIDHII